MKKEKQNQKPASDNGFRLALPFLIVLGTISVISFLIPLRPTQSQMEKRNLAQFPVFTLSAAADGSYFSAVTDWFSDTFPGREQWLTLSSDINSLHGYSEIEILGAMPQTDALPPSIPTERPAASAQDAASEMTVSNASIAPPASEAAVSETTIPKTVVLETAVPEAVVTQTAVSKTTVSETTVPETTVPETTVPETTVPETTVPETTVPETTVPETTVPETTVPETTVPETTVPETTVPETTVPETTVPETQPGWGGIDLDNAGELEFADAVIQIGNAAFNPVGFSQSSSDMYARSLNMMAEIAKTYGARVISAPAPLAVGVLVSPKDQARLNCVDQSEIIRYFHNQMDASIVTVDTYSELVAHNSEYIYFRTDHHWTARGAYYAYRAICNALNYTPVPLEDLEEMDQGEFEGSMYWKTPHPKKLKMDTLIAYLPQGDFTMEVCQLAGFGFEQPMIRDMSQQERNMKYCAFLFGDNPMVKVTNHALPDGPTCLVVKDSFGNALVPFLAQNYSTAYAIDYRKFNESTIRGFLMMHPVDDIIFAPYIFGTQSQDGNNMFRTLCS